MAVSIPNECIEGLSTWRQEGQLVMDVNRCHYHDGTHGIEC